MQCIICNKKMERLTVNDGSIAYCPMSVWDPDTHPLDADSDAVYCMEKLKIRKAGSKARIDTIVKDGMLVSGRTGCPVQMPPEFEGKSVGVMTIRSIQIMSEDAAILRVGGCVG